MTVFSLLPTWRCARCWAQLFDQLFDGHPLDGHFLDGSR